MTNEQQLKIIEEIVQTDWSPKAKVDMIRYALEKAEASETALPSRRRSTAAYARPRVVEAAITADLTRPRTYRQLVEMTGAKASTVASCLTKMRRAGNVAKVRHGVWRAA